MPNGWFSTVTLTLVEGGLQSIMADLVLLHLPLLRMDCNPKWLVQSSYNVFTHIHSVSVTNGYTSTESVRHVERVRQPVHCQTVDLTNGKYVFKQYLA